MILTENISVPNFTSVWSKMTWYPTCIEIINSGPNLAAAVNLSRPVTNRNHNNLISECLQNYIRTCLLVLFKSILCDRVQMIFAWQEATERSRWFTIDRYIYFLIFFCVFNRVEFLNLRIMKATVAKMKHKCCHLKNLKNIMKIFYFKQTNTLQHPNTSKLIKSWSHKCLGWKCPYILLPT